MNILNFLILGSFLIASSICIYSYKFQISKKKILIPSSFLLSKFPLKRNSGSQSYPPRLFLELLTLALISLTLFLLNQEDTQEKRLIIIDTSLSMSAKSENEISALDRAKVNALKSLNPKQINQIISIPFSETKKENKEFRDENLSIKLLEDKIKNFKTSSLPDLISAELQEIIEKSDAEIITLYSDRSLKISNNNTKTKKKIEVKNFGAQTQNAYISEVIETNKAEDIVELEVKINFVGIGSSNISVDLFEIGNENSLATKNIALFPDQTNNAFFSFKPKNNSNYVIKLNKFLHTDSIEVDNYIYWTKTDSQKKEVNIISKDTDSKMLIESITKATSRKTNFIPTEDYNNIKINENDNTFNIFYKVPPPQTFSLNSLIILPTEENEYLKVQNPGTKIEITSWDQKSSLTKYLNFETLKINQSLVFKANSWTNSIITSNEGSILNFGVKDSKKVIISGFELFPFDTQRKSSSDILLLNLLSELSKDNIINENISNLSNQYESLKCISGEEGCNENNIYLKKGIYSYLKNERPKKFIINNINPEESNTYLKNEEIINLNSEDSNLVTLDKPINIPYILFFAIGLILLDLIVIIVRKKELSWKSSIS